ADVRRDRIEAAAWDDARVVRGRARVVARDEFPDPDRLAGDVDVVRAEADAGVDDRRAVERERTGRIENDAGARDDRVDGCLIATVRREDVVTSRRRAERRTDAVQLAPVAAGNRPAQPRRRVPGEVLHRL